MTKCSQLGLGLLIPAMSIALSGCGADNNPFVVPPTTDGLTFTFPVDGMVDVPTPSKAMLVFSSQVNETAVMANCTGTADAPIGAFCVTGPDGPVDTGSYTNIINNGRTIEFSMDGLTPGTTYQVWLRREASPQGKEYRRWRGAGVQLHDPSGSPCQRTDSCRAGLQPGKPTGLCGRQ